MKTLVMTAALAALANGMAMAAPARTSPRLPDVSVDMFHGEVDIRRQSLTFEPNPAKLNLGSFGDTSWDSWLDSAVIPMALRTRPVSIAAYLAVDADDAGKVTGCRLLKSSGEAAFDALACKAVMDKGSFDPFYRAPGKPLARTLNLSVRWRNVDRIEWEKGGGMLPPPPPPPPPPPDVTSWPRRYAPSHIHITSFPKLADQIPPKVKPKGKTSIDLMVDPALGITGCSVGVSSGVTALDETACTVATRLPLSYWSKGCDMCGPARLPLQFVWAGKASHIRTPLPSYTDADRYREFAPRDPSDTRTASGYLPTGQLQSFWANQKDFADLPDKTITSPRVSVLVTYATDGRAVSCKKWWPGTSGNPAVDERLCALLVKRARFRPRQDVFGTDVSEETFARIDLEGITSLTRRPLPATNETKQ